MKVSTSRLAARKLAAAALLVLLGGCGVHQSDDAPLPPPPSAEAWPPAPPTDLAGAPPALAPPAPLPPDGLAGGPSSGYRGPAFVAMAPIANPEDMSAAERHRVYGGRYDRRAGRRHAARAVTAPRRPAAGHAAAPAHAAPARPAPHVAPAAAKPAAPRPAQVAAPAHPADPAHAAPLDPRTARLQTALAVPVVSASSLTAAPAIAQGRPGQVALSLPQNLLEMIRQQAAKAGLARAARSAQVTATLSAAGYDIAPAATQTVPVRGGEAPHFLWSVTPRPGVPHARLHTDVQAALTGERTPRTFPLASFEQPGVSPEAEAASAAKPGFGGLTGSTGALLGAALAFGALILLLVFANRAMANQARARQRRAREAREAQEAKAREEARLAELAEARRARAQAQPKAPPAPPAPTPDESETT